MREAMNDSNPKRGRPRKAAEARWSSKHQGVGTPLDENPAIPLAKYTCKRIAYFLPVATISVTLTKHGYYVVGKPTPGDRIFTVLGSKSP